ncbi:vWA domain-containing protein [Streptomyces sp. NBC_00582]|uniref:vWA domain-containing protein n=1 Tax=Streptomyces sp. NBC_00582 TaxID=2975783 RepID=UPI002E7FE69D|nr:vWA domain-containing protein [Streptomyces sp. NBC_00582]WUB60494.1 VWA domain-containing protein [Streptomyces sp. NBC_00582]
MNSHITGSARGGPVRPRGARGARRARVRRTAGLLTALLLAPATASAIPAGPVAAPDVSAPVELAVAVDESGSLRASDVERERDAAGRIAVGEISEKSRLTVLGFASADNDEQSPVDEVCPTTELDPVAREKAGECIDRLARREKGTGTGTDFPAVIRQAVTRLGEHTGDRPRILFLLTDGKLDVADSPAYGADEESRAKNGAQELTKALAEAARAKVQIWPLGFGDAIDEKALAAMAAGGYRGGCVDLPAARPRAAVVPDSTTLGNAVQRAFAGARCLVTDPPVEDTPPADISLRLSPLATLATVVVSKGDPAVKATYYDPRGRKVEPGTRADGSTFQLAGAGGEVESLRITDPRPGTWRVRLDAPEGHRDRLASVAVQWRGAVRSSIVMTPASPRPGETARVELSLQTRDGAGVGDARDLRRLKVSGRLTGEGFAPRALDLDDTGENGDTKAGDGRFTGTVRIPRTADGALTAVGVLGAVGLTADHRPFLTRTAPVNPDVRAELRVDDAEAHAGDSVPFTLMASNDSGEPRTLRLSLRDAEPGALTLSPSEITVAPGGSVTRTGRLTVGAGQRPHRITARLETVDSEDRTRPLDAKLVTVDVTTVPPWWRRVWDAWWWALVPAAILLLGLLAFPVWQWRQRITYVDPGGLRLRLTMRGGAGERTASELLVPHGRGPWYRFDVLDEPGTDPRLDPRPAGPYALQRHPRGARLRTPGGGTQDIRLGDDVPLEGDVVLRVDRGTGGAPGNRTPGVPRWFTRLVPRRPTTPTGTGGQGRDEREPTGQDAHSRSSYDDDLSDAL